MWGVIVGWVEVGRGVMAGGGQVLGDTVRASPGSGQWEAVSKIPYASEESSA